jgi:hypothetical protein
MIFDKNEALQLKNDGKPIREIMLHFGIQYTVQNYEAFRKALQKLNPKEEKQDAKDIKNALIENLDKPQDIKALTDKFKISERILQAYIEDIQETGYQVET